MVDTFSLSSQGLGVGRPGHLFLAGDDVDVITDNGGILQREWSSTAVVFVVKLMAEGPIIHDLFNDSSCSNEQSYLGEKGLSSPGIDSRQSPPETRTSITPNSKNAA